jgi:hypothetical protein
MAFGLALLVALAVAGNIPVIAAGPPANDDIANATVFSSLPNGDIFSIEQATLAPGDPDASCDVIGPDKTVWYRYTPAASEVVRFNATVNGTLFRYLAVFSGAPGSLTEVACAAHQASTSLSVALTGGVTYYLLVAAADGTSYEITLYAERIAQAANDDFDSATVIGSLPFHARSPTTAASPQTTRPDAVTWPTHSGSATPPPAAGWCSSTCATACPGRSSAPRSRSFPVRGGVWCSATAGRARAACRSLSRPARGRPITSW